MELTKTSVLKLTIVSVGAAVLCFASMAFLGVTFARYWKYTANEEDAVARLENLRSDIKRIEVDVADKQSCVEKISVEYARYVMLTNQNVVAENEKNVVDGQIAAKRETLKKLDGDLVSDQTKLDATSEKVRDAEATLKKLKEEIVEGEKRKAELFGVEESLARKRQEVKDVDLAISEKRAKLEGSKNDLIIAERSLVKVQTNLSQIVEHASGTEKIIGLRKETIASMEEQIATLEERKGSLTKKVDDLEKTLRIQAPKEKTLMDRLATLAGEYRDATNRIVEARAQLKKEIAEAQAELDADIAKKTQDADARVAKSKQTLNDADERAAKIVADAKSTAQEIEKRSTIDKSASEAAVKSKLKAEAAAEIAEQKRKESETKDEAAKASCKSEEAALSEAKAKLAGIEKSITTRSSELSKIQTEIKSLQELETTLSESIAAKKTALQAMSKDAVESK